MEPEDFLPSLSKKENKYFKKVQEQVRYCISCQSYDGGDLIWHFGEETTLDDIFNELEVPNPYRKNIAGYIICPNCGNGGFEQYETIGTEEEFNLKNENRIQKIKKKYGKQIEIFQKYLESFPSLALAKPMGKKIYKEIMRNNVNSFTMSGKWFRSRSVTNSKSYEPKDMDAPPIEKASAGRYNYSGQRVLYLSASKEVAINEAIKHTNRPRLVWLQEYDIKEMKNILDLRNGWEHLWSYTSEILMAILSSRTIDKKIKNRQNENKPQYIITRFIADCAQSTGYSGIIYDSTRCYGVNAVLFKWDDLTIGKPYRHKMKQDEDLIPQVFD